MLIHLKKLKDLRSVVYFVHQMAPSAVPQFNLTKYVFVVLVISSLFHLDGSVVAAYCWHVLEEFKLGLHSNRI